MKKLKIVIVIIVGVILFFIMGNFLVIPSSMEYTNADVQYGMLAFAAAVYGPVAGFVIGFLGDYISSDYNEVFIWWSWVIASGIFGLLVGIGCRGMEIDKGKFGKKEALRFNIVQITAHILSWGIVAPLLDIFMYDQPVQTVFRQGFVAALSNIVITLIFGNLLCVACSDITFSKDILSE